jgi:hypothetical protein
MGGAIGGGMEVGGGQAGGRGRGGGGSRGCRWAISGWKANTSCNTRYCKRKTREEEGLGGWEGDGMGWMEGPGGCSVFLTCFSSRARAYL